MIAIQDRLIFVIGSPRSGSTLLQRMLGAHPQIFTCPEPHIITPLAHLGYYHTVEKAPYDHLRGVDAIRGFVAQLPAQESDYLDACRGYTDVLYSRRLASSGKQYFLDKTPAYALVLDFLSRLYPRARYVVLTRHPVAIFSSYAESFFDGDYQAANDFNPILNRYVSAIAAFIRGQPVPLLHVRYETLVQQPHDEMQRILKFLELPFDESVIEYGRQQQPREKGLGDPVAVDRHSRPVTASVEKWVGELAGDDGKRRLISRIIDSLDPADLQVWGYPYDTIFTPLHNLASPLRKPTKPPLDLFQIQRKVLLRLRRNIHHNLLGRILKKIRFACDVLLR
jgi:hypothetical protein